jgi:uncharacterized protein (TIGR03086 family)
MELDKLYRNTITAWSALLTDVGADDWERPTPCTEWSVRDLVNHVTGENLWTVPLLEGNTIEEVGDRFDGDVLGSDPSGAALDAAAAALGEVTQRLPAGGTVHLSYGDERLEEYIWQLAADHLVHGWDLAVAIGATPRMDEGAVEGVSSWFAEREELYRSAGAIGPRAGTYDDPRDDLLARFGRDPGWKRP